MSSQFIPMGGMLNYIASILDPVRRKAEGPVEAFQRRLPEFSKYLEPYMGPGDKPSKRNWSSYFLPYDMGNADKMWEDWFKELLEKKKKSVKGGEIKKEKEKEIRRERLKEKGWMK